MDIWHILLSSSLLLSLVYGQVWRWLCGAAHDGERRAINGYWSESDKLMDCYNSIIDLASTNHILRNKADKYDLIISEKKEGN